MSENTNVELSEQQAAKIAEQLVKQRSEIFTPDGYLHTDPEILRKAIAEEPDLRVIQEMLRKHLQDYTDHNFVNDRIGKILVSVDPTFQNGKNMFVGGWLMSWNQENRSLPGVLARIIGKTKQSARFVIRHFIAGEWQKPRVLMKPADYRVVREDMARRIAPEAFLPVEKTIAKKRSAA
jgi:hypothetical protein